LSINGYQLTFVVNGTWVLNGDVDCRQYDYDYAELYYEVQGVIGQGTIRLWQDGHGYLEVNQNNNLVFDGIRQ
jgi:hypothetical protein